MTGGGGRKGVWQMNTYLCGIQADIVGADAESPPAGRISPVLWLAFAAALVATLAAGVTLLVRE